MRLPFAHTDSVWQDRETRWREREREGQTSDLLVIWNGNSRGITLHQQNDQGVSLGPAFSLSISRDSYAAVIWHELHPLHDVSQTTKRHPNATHAVTCMQTSCVKPAMLLHLHIASTGMHALRLHLCKKRASAWYTVAFIKQKCMIQTWERSMWTIRSQVMLG